MLRWSGGSRHITMPNFLETGPSIAEILQFFDFLNGRHHHPGFLKSRTLMANGVQRIETCEHAKFLQNRSIGCEDIKIFRFFKIFQNGRHLPSWICLRHIWTTHSEYLCVTITLQNLVMIDAAVFIIWTFQYLVRLAGKCQFMPQKLVFWVISSPKWAAISTIAKKVKSPRRLSHQTWKCGERADYVSCLKKRGINKKFFGYISLICPETLHGRISTKFLHSCRSHGRNHL